MENRLFLSLTSYEAEAIKLTGMQLEIIVISQKDKYHITYMWDLKYDANEPIYETEADSQTQRTDLRLPRGRWRQRTRVGAWG